MKTIIIGTGCAGYNAADWLYNLGQRDITIITEGVNMGASRNTGSDKQTYYKLSLSSNESDSVREMAQTLFDGGSVHGDIALVEAACSVKSFIKLANLGVPFPTNIYGEYVGYKTDHDPRQRATSCGPLTSKLMTEALQRSVEKKGIEVLDNLQVIKLLVSENQVYGLVAVSTINYSYQTIYCDKIILATGGPAGVYLNSVYPESQTGATGLAIDAGAKLINLQEWQYGLASTKFRWNVSGTYQQVLPKYISVDEDGNEREFLQDYFNNSYEALDMVFLKGYQWPFDVRKINGSSKIDMLVHKEVCKGNRVFMDFRTNPSGLDFSRLSKETYSYLNKSDAIFGTPIERLNKMNSKAIQLYKDHNIDLYNEPLEVAVCAQHCNGGIEVDINWQSSVEGLYVVGEAAGTFGVYRPGGSALNSTQVGSMRVAEHIAYCCKEKNHIEIEEMERLTNIEFTQESNVKEVRLQYQKLMGKLASFMRDKNKMEELKCELKKLRENFFDIVKIKSKTEKPYLFKTYDIIVTQISVLSAMIFSAQNCGSRGSGLVIDNDINNSQTNKVIVTINENSNFENVRPIPNIDDWFEIVWNDYNRRTSNE